MIDAPNFRAEAKEERLNTAKLAPWSSRLILSALISGCAPQYFSQNPSDDPGVKGEISDEIEILPVDDQIDYQADGVYDIKVDYTIPLEEVDQIIKMSNLGQITVAPYEGMSDNLNFLGEGAEVPIEVQLIHLGHRVTTREVLAELEKKGFRTLNKHELIAFNKSFNGFDEHPIVFIGPHGSSFSGVIIAHYFGGREYFESNGELKYSNTGLSTFPFKWGSQCRFAAVKKTSRESMIEGGIQ